MHLIAATPWPGFASRWNDYWQKQYMDLLKDSDLVKNICDHYHDAVFRQRNEWMVNHSNRVIAYYNGDKGGTNDTLQYARDHQVKVTVHAEKETEG